MPHGPANAVNVAAPDQFHGASGASFGGGGITIASGWPESMRLMSGSGPLGPILSGVWQSLQTMTVTRYLPRSTWPAAASFFAGGVALRNAAAAKTPMRSKPQTARRT